jgi:hypothetical protein
VLLHIQGRSYAFNDKAESLLEQFSQRGVTLSEHEKENAWLSIL